MSDVGPPHRMSSTHRVSLMYIRDSGFDTGLVTASGMEADSPVALRVLLIAPLKWATRIIMGGHLRTTYSERRMLPSFLCEEVNDAASCPLNGFHWPI